MPQLVPVTSRKLVKILQLLVALSSVMHKVLTLSSGIPMEEQP